jgi:tripartite-type tricarboxylate transporter receptor subunit TctC
MTSDRTVRALPVINEASMTGLAVIRARNIAIRIALMSAAAFVSASTAIAQNYPSKSVKIVVPFPAGGPLDLTTRLLAEKLTASMKQPFVLENRPGGAGNIGTDAVAKASGDGYTLLLVLDTPLTVNPWMYAKLPFNPERDFAPIATVASFSLTLVAHPSMSANTVAEFVAQAKARKDQPMIYGSGGGPGSPGHLAMEYFRMQAGFAGVHVPHKGNAEVVISLVGAQVEAGFLATPGVLQNVRDGRLKAFAVSSGKRSPLAPNIPTMMESGYPGFDVGFYMMMLAPASVSEPVRALLEREVQGAMKSPEVGEKLRAQALEPMASNGVQTRALINATAERWRSVINSSNIRPN